MKARHQWKIRLIALSALLLSGCVFEGTGTGNPMVVPSYGDSPPVGGRTTASDLIAMQLCATGVRCHRDWNDSTCLSAIYPLTDFSAKLGVDTRPAPTLADLHNLEANGRLVADGPATQACLDDLKNFDCANATAQDTWSDLAGWLGPRCADVERPAPP